MSTSSINGPELFSLRSPMESFVYLESFAYLKDDDTAEPSLFQGSGRTQSDRNLFYPLSNCR
jgi:hypothetical protein